MGDPKENPAPVAAGSGAESHKESTFAAHSTAWRRWANHASIERMSARQRRAVLLMAIALAATPERALEALDRRV